MRARKQIDSLYLGALVLVGGSPVAWFSRTQKCVTLSTTEAEYVAMEDGVKEALFINGVLGFMLPGTTLKGIIGRHPGSDSFRGECTDYT